MRSPRVEDVFDYTVVCLTLLLLYVKSSCKEKNVECTTEVQVENCTMWVLVRLAYNGTQ